MKVAIYGGSFNPIHNGHYFVVNELLEKKIVDEVWLMPCKNHAFKNNLAPARHRVEMLKLAFKEMQNVKVNSTELETSGKSYTANTMRILKQKHPHDFYFVAGTDAVNELHKWYDSDYLKNNINFLLIDRQGYALNSSNINLEAIITSPHNISACNIREKIQNNESIKSLVNEFVEKYISDNKLYKNIKLEKKEYVNPGSVVDLIVPYQEGFVFIKRKHEPYKDFWAFPGGYLDCGKETLEEAAVRELYEETSLVTTTPNLKLLGVYSDPGRDPRGHNISHVYEVQKISGSLHANDDASDAKVFKTVPEKLAFDHSKIFEDYKKSIGGAS